jgi:ferredoxin
MHIDSVKLVYFSPTGTTKTVLEGIGRGLQVDDSTHLDLTLSSAAPREYIATADELVIIGAPVYSGRIPRVAEARIRRLQGRDTPAAVVVVYGNRAYEDALLELKDLAEAQGFRVLAGGAFIGEHSFSTERVPIAMSRPDAADLRQATAFGWQIQRKLRAAGSALALSSPKVPGQRPYRERGKPMTIAPATDDALCTLCGDCAAVCPVEAVAVDAGVRTEAETCIICCACVKTCPTDARQVEDQKLLEIAARLSANYAERREPETFV